MTINDPAELNDPAKANAFLRECLDADDGHIAELEAHARQEIQKYRERHPENPEAQRRYESKVMDDLSIVLEPIRERGNRLAEMIALGDRLASIIAEAEREYGPK